MTPAYCVFWLFSAMAYCVAQPLWMQRVRRRLGEPRDAMATIARDRELRWWAATCRGLYVLWLVVAYLMATDHFGEALLVSSAFSLLSPSKAES